MEQLILFHITIIVADIYLKILEHSTSFPLFIILVVIQSKKDKMLSQCFSDLSSFYQSSINYLTKHSKWI